MQIAVLIALWSAFSIALEIPAGILADRWNRRNMLAIAMGLKGLCFITWYFSFSFWMFALGFVFWAIGGAFETGTEESLIFDNLKNDGREHEFVKIYGRAHFYANIGTIAGIASAGAIVNFVGIEIISLLSAAICLVNVVFALQIREMNFYSKRDDKKPANPFGVFKEAGIFIKGSRVALASILFMVLFASLGGYLDEFDALIINDFELNRVWVSVILTVRFAFVALGDILAPVVQKRISSVRQIFLLNAVAAVFLLAFAILWNQYAILVFGLAFMLMAISEILLVNILQNEIKEEGRATVMSFYGVGTNLGMISVSLVYAGLAGLFSLQQVYIIIAVYGILGALCFCIFFKQSMNKTS